MISASYRLGEWEFPEPTNDINSFIITELENLILKSANTFTFDFDINGLADYPPDSFPDDPDLHYRLRAQLKEMLEKLIRTYNETCCFDSIDYRYSIGMRRKGSEASPAKKAHGDIHVDLTTSPSYKEHADSNHAESGLHPASEETEEVDLPQPGPDKESLPELDRKFTALLETIPKGASFEVIAGHLGGLSHQFRQRIAAELAPSLNARIRQKDMPHETLEQKKEVARWVNDQLEPLGLAVKEPKTGRPAKLRGVTGNWPGIGTFQIEVKIDGKQEYPTVSDELPTLELMDVDPPEEVRSNYRELVKRKINRSTRGR